MTTFAVSPQAVLRKVVRRTARLVEGPAARLLPLDASDLLKGALRKARVREVEDSAFLEGLGRLVRSLEEEARLNLFGRIAVREDIMRLLANRFRVERDRRRDPAIAEEEIRRPIFITGLPRSGSTLLHGLLAQDPANRVPQTWEMLDPSPCPRRETYERDKRIRKTERELRWLDRLVPEFRKIHAVGARLPEECVILLAHSFVSSQFCSMYVVPSYQRWVEEQDLVPAYRLHRRFLQHLQRHCRGERWVLKAPAHLATLRELFQVYPDASIIMTHREPLEVLGSEASLHTVLRRAFSDAIDPKAVGREVSELTAKEMRIGLAARDDGCAPSDQFFDLLYPDLVRDPIGAVRAIYAHFDLAFTAAAEAGMRRYLTTNPKDEHGSHDYSLAQFGLDLEEERHRYEDYRARFLSDSSLR